MRFERHFVALAATAVLLAGCGGAGGAAIPGIRADEPSLGKADAPVEFIEYASTACSHCAAFNNTTFHAFKEKHIDTGEVRYALREIVTAPTAFAAAAFLMARCVPEDKYYPVIDAVFRGQHDMMSSGESAVLGLKQIGLAAGLTEDQYNKCVADEAAFKALSERVEKNSKEGNIDATPTFFINGKKATFSAEVTLEQLSKAVADAKAKK